MRSYILDLEVRGASARVRVLTGLNAAAAEMREVKLFLKVLHAWSDDDDD